MEKYPVYPTLLDSVISIISINSMNKYDSTTMLDLWLLEIGVSDLIFFNQKKCQNVLRTVLKVLWYMLKFSKLGWKIAFLTGHFGFIGVFLYE